ncbi:MAG TPA: nucleotidyltransferase [Elusimicrobiota bacterium]|nr:nucleotidyltransferase [Elusimicrobiota bacterium]
MTTDEYLKAVLKAQTLDEKGPEIKALSKRREQVEKLLRAGFSSSFPRIRYAGSRSKGTMIRESYDLDLTCYFANDDTAAGDSLKDIYGNVEKTLQKEFTVRRKNSALRLLGLDKEVHGEDFHIDIVPGRFIDTDEKDVYLHREDDADKERLKTNLDVHVKHVKESGVTEAIRLTKFWRERNGIEIKTFMLELLIVDLLKDKKEKLYETQLKHLWTEFRDHSASLSAKDPANPEGNDLSKLLTETVRGQLRQVAERTMQQVENKNWEGIFGKVEEDNDKGRTSLLAAAIASRPVVQTFKPYGNGYDPTNMAS